MLFEWKGTNNFMISRLFKNNITKNLVRAFVGFIIFPDTKFRTLVRHLLAEAKICLTVREMWNLYDKIKKTESIPGDIAELGVFSGGSAKLICEAKGGKSLRLFDTFSGIPANNFSINKIGSGEMTGGTLSQVKGYLANYNNVNFYEGIFPDSANELRKQPLSFSLVHLDVDIYEATLDGLKFFYPLMSKNGIIIVHDYQAKHLPGVKKAVNEFLKDKQEKLLNCGAKRLHAFYPFHQVLSSFYAADQAMIIKR